MLIVEQMAPREEEFPTDVLVFYIFLYTVMELRKFDTGCMQTCECVAVRGESFVGDVVPIPIPILIQLSRVTESSDYQLLVCL